MPLPYFDAHLDLAMNALAYDRDQTLSIADLRKQEAALTSEDRGGVTVSLPELRRAGAVAVVATVISRSLAGFALTKEPPRTELDVMTRSIAHATAVGQLAYYRLLERQGHMRVIETVDDLEDVEGGIVEKKEDSQHVVPPAHGPTAASGPLGCIVLMEGCDPITTPDEANWWFEQGVRAVSLAHIGPSAYAMGTPGDKYDAKAGLTDLGRELLPLLDGAGFILDLTHSSDGAFAESVKHFAGPIFASHSNARAIRPGTRQITDAQIATIAKRGGVVGIAIHNGMLSPAWEEGKSSRADVSMSLIADHIEHVCRIAGDRDHVGIGSDLDGGYTSARCPHELDTIADVQKLAGLLRERGWSGPEIGGLFSGNWLRFFRAALPRGQDRSEP